MALGVAITPVTLLEVGEISIFENKESTLLGYFETGTAHLQISGYFEARRPPQQGSGPPMPPPHSPQSIFLGLVIYD